MSCASLAKPLLPALANRTLELAADFPGFWYQYPECSSKFLGICTKHKPKREQWDLRDPAVRQMFINMDFVCKAREKH